MELDNRLKQEFTVLLVSAACRGDVDVLEYQLSTVINGDFYLNRVYDEIDNQKCTLLMIACLHGHIHVFRALIHHFKPDLEVLNNILLDEVDETRHLYVNVTVLWAAATMNHLEMVKLLVDHGANVNHKTTTNSTPLRGACYNGNVDMARYLVENGADIHVSKDNNNDNLMVSVGHKHFDMVTYFINELNYDVNAVNDAGRSSLYFAVIYESLEIVEFLLNHGARNFPAITDQMSPLMWAAETRCDVNTFKAISNHCSLIEQIEGEELLGSAFMCFQSNNHDTDQAFDCFYNSLKLRLSHDLPKVLKSTTIEIFDERQECQTLEQLEEIRSNEDRMHTEALLIRERLLGPTNAEYRYSICHRGILLAGNEEYSRAIAFWMYELALYRDYSIVLDSNHVRDVLCLLSDLIFKAVPIPVDVFRALLTLRITEELDSNTDEFNSNLHSLLFVVTFISQMLEKVSISYADRQALYRQLRAINQRQYTTIDGRFSLLHLSLDDNTSARDYFLGRVCRYPCFQTARLLLQCGANVNAIDSLRNTPLHTLTSNQSTYDECTLKILCDAGAHLDSANLLGETPVDLTSNVIVKQFLKSRMKLSLKCLCARLIRSNSIPFVGKLSLSLAHFVEQH